MAPRATPPAVCRNRGCPNPAAGGGAPGFCQDCGLSYIRWRASRDELERGDLQAAGYAPGQPIDPDELAGFDALFRYLTPRPPKP